MNRKENSKENETIKKEEKPSLKLKNLEAKEVQNELLMNTNNITPNLKTGLLYRYESKIEKCINLFNNNRLSVFLYKYFFQIATLVLISILVIAAFLNYKSDNKIVEFYLTTADMSNTISILLIGCLAIFLIGCQKSPHLVGIFKYFQSSLFSLLLIYTPPFYIA